MPIKTDESKQLAALAQHKKLHTHTGWRSFNQENELPQALVIDVEDEAALQAVMKKVYELNMSKAAKNRITVRAAAGGINGDSHSESYSFSPVAQADVIVRLVGDDFRTIQSVAGKENQVKVGASLQIGEVDKQLYDDFDLSLPTASLIPYVTVAGLSATAGNGTGKNQPSFAGLIQAMRLCLPNGEIVRIDSSHPDFETIRGSHLGLFGIVLDVELACTQAMKIKTTMDVNSVPEFLQKVKDGLFEKYPYVSAMYMPTYHEDEREKNDVNNIIVYAWEPVPKSTPDMNNNPNLSRFGQYLAMQFEEKLHLLSLLRTFPSLIPHYMRYFASKIGVGSSDNVAVGPWHEMVHYQTAFPWDLTEFGPIFPVSDQPKNGKHTPEIYAAFEKLVSELTASAKKGEYPLVYAAYLRYFQGTNGGLSQNMHGENQHVCAMDMTTGHDIPGFTDFARRMAEFTLGTLHAKPHWGKNIPEKLDFKEMYGEHYIHFREVLDSWYARHGMDFQKSPLLNGALSNVLTPDQPVASPYSTPLRVAQHPVCTSWAEAKANAEEFIEFLKDDENPEAKAFCDALRNTCTNHVEGRVSSWFGSMFPCLKDAPAKVLTHENPKAPAH